jgi:predicted permease
MRLAPLASTDSAVAVLADRFSRPLLERVRAIPGVTSAGTINILPIESWGFNGPYWADAGPRPERGKEWSIEHREVSPGYFATMGIPILAGRELGERDGRSAEQPIMLNEAAARQAFPNGRAVGERIRRWDGPQGLFTVVGVVGNVRQASLDRAPLPEMYMAYGGQYSNTEQTLVVKSSVPPATLLPLLREQVRAVDPFVPVYEVQSMDQVLAESLGARRLSLTLVGAFAALALILAASGLYGVIAFLVAQRTSELGVRMALGADRGRILRLILGQGARLAGAGIVIGLAGALAFSRLMASLLYGVSVRDTLTFAIALVSLGVTALLASLVPALRAARTTPLVALRSD